MGQKCQLIVYSFTSGQLLILGVVAMEMRCVLSFGR